MNIPHLKYHLVFVLSFLLALTHQAQTILYAEDFNGCELPSDWTVNVVGGGTPVWNVGMPDNTNSDGTTIDGTCMLIIDDDAAGDGTEGYKVQFTTPTFDATQFSTIELSMDVHFRNYETSSLKIFVFDGNEFQEIKKYDSYEDATGQQFSEFETYVTDLSFYANQNMSIMIQYDDADYFAWWAGVDNIEVVGTGTATNVVLETFNDCVLPLGWTAEIVQGDDAWQFGYVTNPNAWDGNSMNGNCFAFFDDDVIGDSAAYSVVRLFSPVFDGTAFATFTLDYDLVFRRAVEGENLTIYVFDGQEFHFVKTYTEDTGGPQFTAPVDEVIDLSAYRSENMQIVFQYEDGDGYGWWVGIDNVKVSGEGLINDLCENAFALQTGVTCLEGNNLTALFTGDEPSCGGKNVGSLWYTYQADFTGIAKIETRATFNELITIYEGGCAAATELHCYNRDEHGFTGEIFYVNITSGNEYLIRVSGLDEVFGVPRGSLCIDLQEVANFPNTPTNDDCVNAVPLTVGGACVDGNNYNANFSGPEPSRNNRSRADIWYSFLATTTDELLIESNADFADVITLFSGTCGNLTEVAINDHGQELKVEGLTMGEIYFIQISGYFATVEGNICVAINANSGTPPANDDCANPILVNVDGGCVAANNAFASLDGPTPSCEIYPQSDIWYQFTAPANGSVKFNTGGGFPHTISVYHGGCNDLEEVFCAHNPLACDGFVLVNNLLPNETYLVQISSSQSTFGYTQGDLCLEILNGNSTADTPPLSLSVDVNCLGLGSGELNVFIAGGTGNYTVQGNAGGDTLATGETYLVIVTDDAGCERSVTGTIGCGEMPCGAATAGVTAALSCYGDTNGGVEVTAASGTPPFIYSWSNGVDDISINNLSAGIYTVTITDSTGCQIMTSVLLQQPVMPQIMQDSIQNNINNTGSGLVDVTILGGTAPYDIEWTLDGTVISTDEDIANLMAGEYILNVTDANNCSFPADTFLIDDVVGTGDLNEKDWIAVFPNPTMGKVFLKIELSKKQAVYIAAYDITGKFLMEIPTEEFLEKEMILDFSDFAAGVYTLKVRVGDDVVVRKVVVER